MSEIHLLSQDERELFFRAATDIKKMPFEIIEKDYGHCDGMFLELLEAVREHGN